jgi:transcriptional regulator of met regulon
MVTKPSALETPTQALIDGTDPISDAQGKLDNQEPKQPATESQSEYVTRAEYDRLSRMVSGLQGSQDRGFARLGQYLDRQDVVDRDELVRQAIAKLGEDAPAEDIAAATIRAMDESAQAAPTQAPVAQASAADQIPQAWRKVAEELGVDWEDPRVDYRLLKNSNGAYEPFITHLYRDIIFADAPMAATPAAGPSAPPSAAQPAATPPAAPPSGPAPVAGAYSTPDAVIEAANKGQIPWPEANQMLRDRFQMTAAVHTQ